MLKNDQKIIRLTNKTNDPTNDTSRRKAVRVTHRPVLPIGHWTRLRLGTDAICRTMSFTLSPLTLRR